MSGITVGVTPCDVVALASGSEAMRTALAAAQEIIDGVKADTRPLPSPEEVSALEGNLTHAYAHFYDEVTKVGGGKATLDAMEKEMGSVLELLWAGRKEAYWEERDYAADAADAQRHEQTMASVRKEAEAKAALRSTTQHSGEREDMYQRERRSRPSRGNARRQALNEGLS